MFPERLLINIDTLPQYVVGFLDAFLRQHGAYMITAERYVKLTQDEKTLDYITKREPPAEQTS